MDYTAVRGVKFSADGNHILVCHDEDVMKFSTATGAFINNVETKAASFVKDVLEYPDGSLVVACGLWLSPALHWNEWCKGEQNGYAQ